MAVTAARPNNVRGLSVTGLIAFLVDHPPRRTLPGPAASA
jgi:hypothetical protein